MEVRVLSSASISIRPARADDLDELVRVVTAAWREGFGHLMPPELLVPPPDRLREGTRLRLARAPAPAVAVEDAAVRGYVSYGDSRDEDAGRAVGEVHALHVDPPAWRRGIGSALLCHAVASLRGEGRAAVTVWSLAGNKPANAFYEAHGFGRDGAEQRREQHGSCLELRYRLEL